MPPTLRVLSLSVLAIWLGSSVFLTFGVGPAMFSNEVLQIVPRYHAGRIAQVMLQSFFWFQLGCGIGAVLLLLAEWAYLARAPRGWSIAILVALMGLVLVGGLGIQPRLRQLHQTMYAPDTTPEEKQRATQSFRRWHGVSQVGNLFLLLGVTVYFVQLAYPRTSGPKMKYPVGYF